MSEFQRRDFLAGAIGLAAGTAAVLTAQSKAEGGDPSFKNNVPDPICSPAKSCRRSNSSWRSRKEK